MQCLGQILLILFIWAVKPRMESHDCTRQAGSNLLYSAPSTHLVLIHQEFQGHFDHSQATQTASLSTGLSEQLNLGTRLSTSWVKIQSISWGLVLPALICGYRGKSLWRHGCFQPSHRLTWYSPTFFCQLGSLLCENFPSCTKRINTSDPRELDFFSLL